jgi:hypothetical protein
MERSHTPLSVWFWAACLVARETPGSSSAAIGLTRYETAFGILHKLRAGMVRPDQNRIGSRPKEHVEVDETWLGGRTRGEGRASTKRKVGRYAGRVRPAIATYRGTDSLCGFVENAVMPGYLIVTDDWSGYASLRKWASTTLQLPNVANLKWPNSSRRRHPPRREREASTSLPQ